ncbi:hypothetical protein ACIO5Z_14620 [Streptomyces rochei]|uniref:Uncharacterized protein n=1 Tax=Streptomyces rochei TaxID=1928 RepID=A0ABW7DUG2_STRRO
MPTTSYGYELAIGDDTDRDDVPVCDCGEDMTGKDAAHGRREYSCDCGVTVTIAPSGLVFDITD